jgi:hypothetical protein
MAKDNRTAVDRQLDRIKNNRIAAVLIVVAVGIGAAASLTDSMRTLGSALSSFTTKSAAGEWKTQETVFYPDFDKEFLRLHLQEAAGNQVMGFLQFSGNKQWPPRRTEIIEAKRNGNLLTLSFHYGNKVRDTIVAEIARSELRLVLHHAGQAAVATTATRVTQAPQLIAGRFAIVYRDEEFADHRAACEKMLQDFDPPQTYKLSEPPDENGDVHCAGTLPDGTDGFDQYKHEIARRLICPANSRITYVEMPASPILETRCECDGEFVASAGCGPR